MQFDDYLDLAHRDFSGTRLIAFCGVSGSGKSTMIEHFLKIRVRRETDYIHVRADAGGLRVDQVPPHSAGAGLIVLDELRERKDLRVLKLALRRYRQVLVASHLRAPAFRFLFVPRLIFDLDRDPGKIARYLAERRVPSSEEAVAVFFRNFGAAYTDVDIILERYPGLDFDAALGRFLRFDRLRREDGRTM